MLISADKTAPQPAEVCRKNHADFHALGYRVCRIKVDEGRADTATLWFTFSKYQLTCLLA
jgi:hypothetical protein